MLLKDVAVTGESTPRQTDMTDNQKLRQLSGHLPISQVLIAEQLQRQCQHTHQEWQDRNDSPSHPAWQIREMMQRFVGLLTPCCHVDGARGAANGPSDYHPGGIHILSVLP